MKDILTGETSYTSENKVDTNLPLKTDDCQIDDECLGERWEVDNEEQLVRLIALVAMGQADWAAHILSELTLAYSLIMLPDIIKEAKNILIAKDDSSLSSDPGQPRTHRDGFIFEVISWMAARQISGSKALMKGPHVQSTTQGLDGLILELFEDNSDIKRTTICEDKCTENQRNVFISKVIPAFLKRHSNTRNIEIISEASALLQKITDVASATKIATSVIDPSRRRYRAAFVITENMDTVEKRKKLFADYNKIDKISQKQRLGACFIVQDDLRAEMEKLAQKAIAYLDELLLKETLN